MAFDVQAAKADGYTDEEIQAYLDSKGTPTPAETAATTGQPVPQYQPIDRSEEYTGLAQGVGLEGLKTAAELGGLYYGGKKLLGAAGKAFGSSGPVVPTPTPQQQTFNALKATDAQNAARSVQQPSVVQRGMDYAKQMQKIAAEKVMAGARAAGPAMATAGRAAAPYAAPAAVGLGALTFSGGLNTNEEEELRRRRAMAPTITR
jgi:hypothetical protein